MSVDDFAAGKDGQDPTLSAQNEQATGAGRTRFPWERLFYALGFGVVAWFVFWLLLALAVVQFVLLLIQSLTPAVTGHPSTELKRFNLRMLEYLMELLAYVTFVRDTLPFPFGPFPAAPTLPNG